MRERLARDHMWMPDDWTETAEDYRRRYRAGEDVRAEVCDVDETTGQPSSPWRWVRVVSVSRSVDPARADYPWLFIWDELP